MDVRKLPTPIFYTENGDTINPTDHFDEPTPLDDLDGMERTFVIHFMANGNAREAAKAARYSRNVQECASVLLNKPRIRKAIRAMRASRRESVREFNELSAQLGVQTMVSMVLDPEIPPQMRLAAAARLASQSTVTPGRDMTDDLTDDVALEKLDSKKSVMAVMEFKKSNETVVDENTDTPDGGAE